MTRRWPRATLTAFAALAAVDGLLVVYFAATATTDCTAPTSAGSLGTAHVLGLLLWALLPFALVVPALADARRGCRHAAPAVAVAMVLSLLLHAAVAAVAFLAFPLCGLVD